MGTYKIGRPFSGYEYTTVEAESFEDALDVASHFGQWWEFDPETHLLEDGDTWIRNNETLEDRTY